MATKIVLSRKQFYDLTQWVDKNRDRLRALTMQQAAEIAKTETNLHVTANSMQIIRDTLDLPFWRKHSVGVLRKEPEVQFVAGVLKYVMEKLGEPVPHRLTRIAQGMPTNEED